MPLPFIRFIYSLVFSLALPVLLFRMLWRSRKAPGYRKRWLERFGVFPTDKVKTDGLWLHAVSVGEAISAIPLIKTFMTQYPQIPVTVTTMTPTGSERIQAAFGDRVFHVYIPYDMPWAVKGFLDRIQPRWAVVMETEIWPNLLHACEQRKIPVVIANGRISPRSLRGYLRLGSLMPQLLDQVVMVAAQSGIDQERFQQLGMPKDRVQVYGNIKYDVSLPGEQILAGDKLKRSFNHRPVWIAASTHAGEEAQVLAAHKLIQQRYKDSLLILAPRHPERFNEVAALLKNEGVHYVRRSGGTPCDTETDVLLGDTMGEMIMLYRAADVAFVAGSFAPIGGHNFLEPAAIGVPMITGPHVHNFVEIEDKMCQAGALQRVNSPDELADTVMSWFACADTRMTAGKSGKEVVALNQGAIGQMMQLIQSMM